MKKLLWIFPVLLLFLTPAFAQHGRNQGGNRAGERRQSFDREPREHKQAVREHKGEYREHRGDRDRSFERRDHRDARRFDHDYFRGHYGVDHRFYWHHCRWYGPRFVVGSRFYYGGGWFIIVDPIPDYWGFSTRAT